MNKNVKLAITDITWTGGNQVKPNTAVVFSITLKNEGTEDMIAGQQETTLQLHIGTAEPEWIRYDGGLKAGESKTFESQAWTAVVGNFAITATVNFAMPSPTTWESGVVFVKYLRVADETLAVPEFAAAAGMNNLVFNDDFTTLDTIDVNATGEMGYLWYVTRPYGMTDVTPEDYTLTENGIKLHVHNSPHHYELAMVDSRTGAGWGYKHGYMEARFKVQPDASVPGTKGGPAIWAMPAERYWCWIDHWVELDHMEYWGDIFGGERMYSVTLHEQTCEYGNGHDAKRWSKNIQPCYYGLGDDEWHTMGWLWEEGRFTAYLDGKELFTQRWNKDGMVEPDINMVRGERYATPFAKLDEYSLPVTISGDARWPMEVDYLRIWQK